MTSKIGRAINNNDIGSLKKLLRECYFDTNLPTMTKADVDNFRMMCIFSKKYNLVAIFDNFILLNNI